MAQQGYIRTNNSTTKKIGKYFVGITNSETAKVESKQVRDGYISDTSGEAKQFYHRHIYTMSGTKYTYYSAEQHSYPTECRCGKTSTGYGKHYNNSGNKTGWTQGNANYHYQYYICDACNTSYGNYTKRGIHNSNNTITGYAATCTTAGLTDGKECSICGKTMVSRKIIPVLGHDWGDWTITKSATCSEKGQKTRTCSRDTSHIETADIEKNPDNHTNLSYQSKTPATCTADGINHYECTGCGTQVDRVVKGTALGHNWVEAAYGYHYTCSRCGTVTNNPY